MSDTPPVPGQLHMLHTASGGTRDAFRGVLNTSTTMLFVSLAYPTANLAFYIPFVVRSPMWVASLFIANGATVSGSYDMGVYNSNGVLLVNTGSTVQVGTSTLQKTTLGTKVFLTVGSYYFAVSVNNTTATMLAYGSGAAGAQRMIGLGQQSTAFTLPATFTKAANTTDYYPLIGISSRTDY